MGPAKKMKAGATVEVWNKRRRTFTKVVLRSVLSSGDKGLILGFPGKAPAIHTRDTNGPQPETLEQWKKRRSAS